MVVCVFFISRSIHQMYVFEYFIDKLFIFNTVELDNIKNYADCPTKFSRYQHVIICDCRLNVLFYYSKLIFYCSLLYVNVTFLECLLKITVKKP